MERKKWTSGIFNWTFFGVLLVGLILINIIASFIYFRYDATADKRYTLSEGTELYLKDTSNFSNRIFLKIYLEGNLPAEVQRFRNSIEDKLKEFKQFAGSRLEYEFVDPMAGSEGDQRELFEELYNKGRGIVPAEIAFMKDGAQTQMMLWPGAKIEYSGRTDGYVQFLPGTPQGKYYTLNAHFESQIENSINNLEYMLVSALRRTTQKIKPRIAFLQGHGELEFKNTQRIRSLISPYYQIEDIDLKDSIDALKGVKGLIIARPTKNFSDKDKYLIDQFLMDGGRLMCFLDKLYLNEDTLHKTGISHSTRYELNLDKMLFDYGLKINDNYVIDVRCAPKLIPASRQKLIPWFFDVAASPTSHPIARNLDPVMLRFTSEVQFVGNHENIAPILTSSTNSSVTGLAPLVSLAFPLNYGQNPMLVPDPEDESNKVCLAGLVEGSFESHYKNRIVDAFINNPAIKYHEKSVREGKVLVVGNGRFIQNDYDSTIQKGQVLYRPKALNGLRFDKTMAQMEGMQPIVYGNQEFFQNLVDYMMGDHSVLDLRSKQIDINTIDKEAVKVQANTYKWLNMAGPSLLVLALAFLFFYLRKRKYVRSERVEEKIK
ncbi:MAG: gliding motility-associated ABC transporter substrate-binding protein GldG [Bacteroidetes bacterium]|nr:MAG: gliding motility-associated ABC transporter substrate-binding protein GldG [Bacteroidota bacterium]